MIFFFAEHNLGVGFGYKIDDCVKRFEIVLLGFATEDLSETSLLF